jgi:hypothetical protein
MNFVSSSPLGRPGVDLTRFLPVTLARTKQLLLSLLLLLAFAHRAPAPIFEAAEKLPTKSETKFNADGSHTVYEIANDHRTGFATVFDREGKVREKIRYELDNLGHPTSRTVLDAEGNVRSKSLYLYDKTGRIKEETRLGQDNSMLHKIAYAYDQSGNRTGYSIFDGNGKLLNQQGPAASKPVGTPKPSEPSRRRPHEFEGSAPGG